MSLEKELREAAGKATPGPWWTDGQYSGREMGCAVIAARTDAGPLPGNPTRGMIAWASAILNTEARQCEANARFIAACDPANILALLDRLEKMREALSDGRRDLRLVKEALEVEPKTAKATIEAMEETFRAALKD